MSASAIYDFENNVAAAFAAALSAQGFTVVTASTSADFQQKRPRVELIFKPAGAVSPAIITFNGTNGRVITAYRGELVIKVVTGFSTAQKQEHATYRAGVRAAMELDKIRNAINQTPSVYSINFVMPSGCGQTLKYQDGYEVTDLSYAIDFSIQADAWSQL